MPHSLQDCMAYYRLTKLLCTEAVDTIPATEDEARNLPVEDLAHTLLSCIYSNDVPAWLSVEGVTSTNPRMHISLCALLFRARPNLGDTEDAVGNLPERRTSVAQNKRRASSVQIAGFQKELAEMMSVRGWYQGSHSSGVTQTRLQISRGVSNLGRAYHTYLGCLTTMAVCL